MLEDSAKSTEVSSQIYNAISHSTSGPEILDLQVAPNIIKYEPTACTIWVRWARNYELKKPRTVRACHHECPIYRSQRKRSAAELKNCAHPRARKRSAILQPFSTLSTCCSRYCPRSRWRTRPKRLIILSGIFYQSSSSRQEARSSRCPSG